MIFRNPFSSVGCWAMTLAATLLLSGPVNRTAVAEEAADKSQPATPLHQSDQIFSPIFQHTHGSCIVECPNGDLLVCWYQGSGERRADDVVVLGARRQRGQQKWSEPFLMADAPGFPDTNPCLLIDPRGKLWLIWQTIIANEWHTALARYKISSNYESAGAPVWESSDDLILKPGPEFAEMVAKQCDLDEQQVEKLPAEQREKSFAYLKHRREHAADKYFIRMGWMTRVHPLVIDGRRLIVPLYSDGFDFSIMAISEDWGATWSASHPLVSHGGVQPSVARRKDGTLVAMMRDNGPPPKRILRSTSTDGGRSWSPVVDTEVLNPGAGVEVIALASGRWLLINNDTEKGRHRLSVSLSEDEGETWKWNRPLEVDEPGPEATTASYPSIVQSKDGLIHATYTYTLKGKNAPEPTADGKREVECIKHAVFNEEWIRQSP